jgi:hypothetical protein
MKKILSILVVLFLVTSAFAGLAEAEKIRIVHIHWTQPPYDEIVAQTAEEFYGKVS